MKTSYRLDYAEVGPSIIDIFSRLTPATKDDDLKTIIWILRENPSFTCLDVTSFFAYLGAGETAQVRSEVIVEILKASPTITAIEVCESHISSLISKLDEIFKSNTTITSLSLLDHENNIDDIPKLVEFLRSNRTITNLCLRGSNDSGFDDGAIAQIVDALADSGTAVVALDLSFNQVGDLASRAVSELLEKSPTLLNLNLDGNKISAENAQILARGLKVNKTVASLVMPRTDLGVNLIIDALKENQTVTSLDFGTAPIDDQAAEALAAVLEVNTTIKSLSIQNTVISDRGLSALAQALKKNPTIDQLTIKNLDLKNHQSSLAFADILKTNPTITNLDISEIKSDDQGIAGVAQALKTNRAITNLVMAGCLITDWAMLEIIEALKARAVEKIDLSFNQSFRSEKMMPALLEALEQNENITDLSLASNQLSSADLLALAEFLKTNTTLVSLNLNLQNNIDNECFVEIAAAVFLNLSSQLTVITTDEEKVKEEIFEQGHLLEEEQVYSRLDQRKVMRYIQESKMILWLGLGQIQTDNPLARLPTDLIDLINRCVGVENLTSNARELIEKIQSKVEEGLSIALSKMVDADWRLDQEISDYQEPPTNSPSPFRYGKGLKRTNSAASLSSDDKHNETGTRHC